MITSNKKIVQQIVLSCFLNGIKKVIVSPGSRNAPLSISFDECDDFDCVVIHDERCAAFFGLGIAEQLNEPVALVCTSGSALLNYYPAIAEAYYREIPLVVISADRPPEWINHGDGQTIVQNNIYSNHILSQINLNDDDQSTSYISAAEKKIQELFNKCLSNRKGPAHINIGLNEPLYETSVISKHKSLKIETSIEDQLLKNSDIKLLTQDLNASKILILVGQACFNNRTRILLSDFAQNTNVAVLVENTSNLYNKDFVHCIDRTLTLIPSDKALPYAPDVLITIGGAVISKKIKQFLRINKAKKHYRISYAFPEMDTYRSLYKHFDCSVSSFFETLSTLPIERNTINYASRWKQLDYKAKDRSENFYKEIVYSDLSVFNEITKHLSENMFIHMANSSVVRYFQLFDPFEDLNYFCNRGTSGIDGSTSTALGAAFALPNKEHLLVSGDLVGRQELYYICFFQAKSLFNSGGEGN